LKDFSALQAARIKAGQIERSLPDIRMSSRFHHGRHRLANACRLRIKSLGSIGFQGKIICERGVSALGEGFMATATPLEQEKGYGKTSRRDNWWVGPISVLIGLSLFVVYSTWSGLQGKYFEIRENTGNFTGPTVAPYLSPFYSPLLYDSQSPHAWIHQDRPQWWPDALPFSAAILILAGPGLFRLTCYYYRKAYYRAFWADPPACAVGEPRKSYWGENHWPLLLQNVHRYTLYIALIFLVFLWWDALQAFWWPTNRAGEYLNGSHRLGLGLGTLIMLVNVYLLSGFTFGCNSLRHLSGGGLNQFACYYCPSGSKEPVQKLSGRYHAWRFVSYFTAHHMAWAWLSLFSVGFTDLYIRMCAKGIWTDLRFF
jgi:hypothetical protein